MGVLEEDENFQFLYKVSNGNLNAENSQIVTYLTRFRKSLSFSWISQFRDEARKSLILVLKMIFKFATNSDATVRVNSYNTLGGLLIAVAPYCSQIFIAAFAEAVVGVEVSPKVSIAIINTFLYLTRFISPIRMDEFVCSIPINSHFGVDLSEFIQYIPQVIPLMENLPIVLKQNILRSIVCGCKDEPNYAFTSSVSLLISMNKKEQIDILVDLIIKNHQLGKVAVWLGPVLLEDREVYDLIGEKGRELFLTRGINFM
ncbi:hypothetical protein GPJ56_002392 [Histomonas meleagridis]|uniref:uncharacterized protein n=1 Tax=Histomonas meleagridis TaxID=135588 RepID=UPI00355A9E59|nr:hypothetical protein GPJ56_002392 [Histomonas meleagridis]KAH0801876.1 hypothetical protein GO595_005294 [Histomonas meleagridis]